MGYDKDSPATDEVAISGKGEKEFPTDK